MIIITRRHWLGLMSLILAAAGAAPGTPVELVRDQESEFVIYYDEAAPPSVALAASELQDYLYKVSGAKLAIVHEPRPPMICLGDNAASRAAGLSAEDIPAEGFRVATRAGNVFILGPDTAEGERTADGGSSTGTRNGTYAFIERFLGVRWLVPGGHGDYVPKSTSITIPETALVDAPFFLNRRVPYTQQDRREVKRWWARQRLRWSLYLNHSHNWSATIPASHFDEHPDWFPERGGVRVPPTGQYKLCTTNPGVVGSTPALSASETLVLTRVYVFLGSVGARVERSDARPVETISDDARAAGGRRATRRSCPHNECPAGPGSRAAAEILDRARRARYQRHTV